MAQPPPQTVRLDRGMASVVHAYLEAEQRAVLARFDQRHRGQRLSTIEALSLVPLAKLLQQLAKLITRDQKPPPKKPRPHQLQLAYPEMTTLRVYYARMLASAACHPESHVVLATVLGRFHQPSLSLESHIALAPVTRLAGYQTTAF
jgi:hypothetical protein